MNPIGLVGKELPKPGEFSLYRWQSANSTAWQYYRDKNFKRAEALFNVAIEHANDSKLHQYRCGSSLAGKALTRYAHLKSELYPEGSNQKFVEPTNRLADILNLANSALTFFSNNEYPLKLEEQLGELHLLIGTIQTKLCLASQAQHHYRLSAESFERSGNRSMRAVPLHALAKFHLCRREFANAANLLDQVWQLTNNPNRRAASLLDSINILVWRGQLRQAKQMTTYWPNTAKSIEPEDSLLQLRALLLFAKVEIELGTLPIAAQLLDKAHELFCRYSEAIPLLAKNVFYILSAKLATLNREFESAKKYHNKIQLPGNYPIKGFDILQLIAIDAGCHQCITECLCVCTNVVCDCCCPCQNHIVCFEEKVTHKALFNFKKLFDGFAKLNQGNLQYFAGDYSAAEYNFKHSKEAFSTAIHSQSPVVIEPHVMQIHAKRRRQDSTNVAGLINQAIELTKQTQPEPIKSNSTLPSIHPLWVDLYLLSGLERMSLSNSEIALKDLQNSIRISQAARSIGDHRSIDAHLNQIDGLTDLSLLDRARKRLFWLQDNLVRTDICDCWLMLQCRLRCAKIHIFCKEFDIAYRQLTHLESEWQELTTTSDYSESNLAPIVLWKLIVEIERLFELPPKQALVNSRFLNLFNRYSRLTATDQGVSPLMIAHQLNRAALTSKKNGLYLAAAFLYRKSIELYSHAGMPEFKATVEKNLNQLNQQIRQRRAHE